MYDFTDTIEQAAANKLPVEAVSINGVYIEDEISGYRTLYTSGRESLEKEFESYNDTVASGSLTKYTRFPARTITVGFQLLTESPESFRDAFNQLNGILNTEDAEIIFNDEQDKFFTGSTVMNADIEPGLMSVKGEYQIYCADPFKYSVDLQQPQPVFTEDADTGLAQTFLINYEGTYPAYPQYIAKFYNPDGETDEDNAEYDQTDMAEMLENVGGCSFVAFMDDENHVLQFGNPDIDYGDEIIPDLTLANRSFRKSGSYDASKNGEAWVSPAKGYSGFTNCRQQGSIGTGAAIYGASQQTLEKDQVLLATTSGTNCKYKATVTRVNGRTSSKVTLHIQVKISSLKKEITKGATLTVEASYSGKAATKTLKSSNVTWKKGTAHSCSFTMTVEAGSTKTELSGIKLKVTRKNGTYKSGKKTKKASGDTGKLSSKSCKLIEIPYYVQVGVDSYYLRPSGYGDAVKNYYTGPTLTWTYPSSGLPATDDAVGAKNFTLTWDMKFCMGKTTNETMQKGAFECIVLTGDSMDANGNIKNQKVLTRVAVYKKGNGSKGKLYLYYGGKSVFPKGKELDLTWNKGKLGNKSGFAACEISKYDLISKQYIGFHIGSFYDKQFVIGYDMAAKRAYKVVFGFYRYGADPAFDWNGIKSVSLKKKYLKLSSAEENPFSATQVLVADSSNGEVTLDGMQRPDLGALGNDWEQMCLTPGTNEITTAYQPYLLDRQRVIRRCREDEAYQGTASYGSDEEGEEIEVSSDDNGAKVYYTLYSSDDASLGPKDISDISVYADRYIDDDGKQHIEAVDMLRSVNNDFIETDITSDEYDADPAMYFVLEETAPEFSISYREVYL